MATRGLANTTTKEIARAAGLSEAMLYKLFRDKVDLFLAVLSERLPPITGLDDDDDGSAPGALPARLRQLVAEILAFYLESFPIAASVFSDPDLLTRHRQALDERGAGPQHLVAGVRDFLAAEQREHRIGSAGRPAVLAELLVGACLHHAFLVRFAGRQTTANEVTQFAYDLVDALAPALHIS